MKKTLLSLLVVVAFVAYGLLLRHQDEEHKVIAPATSSPDNTVTNTTAPTTETTNTQSSPTSPSSPATPTATPSGQYKNGTYTGSNEDAFYGNVQVKITIASGKISNVTFLSYPNDRRESIDINSQAMPYLQQEAIQVQNANVDIISGATMTSEAFRRSLATALQQAS